MKPTRRHLLKTTVGLAAADLLLPSTARAVSPADRKFVFIMAMGGWDTTRVLDDALDYSGVSTESDVDRKTAGAHTWISHPDRPAVDRFFERYGDRTALVRGMLVPSIAHETCFSLALTGELENRPDWPSILASTALQTRVAPNLVLSGPSFPAHLTAGTIQLGTSAQLTGMLGSAYFELLDRGDPLSLGARQRIDTFVQGRAEAELLSAPTDTHAEVLSALVGSLERSTRLEEYRHQMAFDNLDVFDDGVATAVTALSLGLVRCVALCVPFNADHEWDTHTVNDGIQHAMWSELFVGLNSLVFNLEQLPGEQGGTLLDETTIVVMSEMGRTPYLNSGGGKDHWPFTSAILIGSGIAGGVSVGAYDSGWAGVREAGADGDPISCGEFGATLLALGDVDPAEFVDDEPLGDLLG